MTTIRGLSWAHARGHAPMVATSAAYTDLNPDVRLRWKPRSLDAFSDGSLEQFLGTFDLVTVDHPLIGEAVAAGWIQPLDELISAETVRVRTKDAVGASMTSYQLDGKTWALPLDGAALATGYRRDLIHWDQPSIEDLAHSMENGARVAIPTTPFSCIAIYLTLCAQLGETPFADANRVVRPDVGRPALQMMHRLVSAQPNGVYGMGTVALLTKLGTTNDLDAVTFGYGYSTYSRRGYVPHPVTFAPLPAFETASSPRPTLGGVGLAVLAAAPQPQAAADFAEWVTSPLVQAGLFTTSGGQPASRTAWDDPLLNQLNDGFFTATRPSLDHAFVRPNAAWYGRSQKQAGTIIQRAMRDGEPAEITQTRLDALFLDARSKNPSAVTR